MLGFQRDGRKLEYCDFENLMPWNLSTTVARHHAVEKNYVVSRIKLDSRWYGSESLPFLISRLMYDKPRSRNPMIILWDYQLPKPLTQAQCARRICVLVFFRAIAVFQLRPTEEVGMRTKYERDKPGHLASEAKVQSFSVRSLKNPLNISSVSLSIC